MREHNWNPKQKIIARSKFNVIETIKSGLKNERQQTLFQHGPFGHIQDLEGTKFPKHLMHLLVLHRVESNNSKELWFDIGGNIAVFTMYDFQIMSGNLKNL